MFGNFFGRFVFRHFFTRRTLRFFGLLRNDDGFENEGSLLSYNRDDGASLLMLLTPRGWLTNYRAILPNGGKSHRSQFGALLGGDSLFLYDAPSTFLQSWSVGRLLSGS